MRAILNNDIIVTLTMSATEGTEIGSLPKGVGLERLRFDGTQVIDLISLTAIWVKHIGGTAFELHCVDIGHYETTYDDEGEPDGTVFIGTCQLVTMAYANRHVLTNENGIYRLKTLDELEAERIIEANRRAKGKLVQKVKAELGGIEEFQIHSLAFIAALIIYARNQPPALGDFFDDIIPHIQDMFPMSQWESILKNSAQKLKVIIGEYNANIE